MPEIRDIVRSRGGSMKDFRYRGFCPRKGCRIRVSPFFRTVPGAFRETTVYN